MGAIARRHRQTPDERVRDESSSRLRRLSRRWLEIETDADVRRVATDLLFRHPLKAADALQLATAITVSAQRSTLPFVTLDQTLAAAARAEGFNVLP